MDFHIQMLAYLFDHYSISNNYYESLLSFRLIAMYLLLPETEERTLEDIEMHFSDNKRKLTDRKIARNVTAKSFNDSNAIVIECDRQINESNKQMNSPETIRRKNSTAHTNKAFIGDN